MRQPVITGIGLVAPMGVGATIFWDFLIEGRSCIRRITGFDVSTYSCQIGGEVIDRSYEDSLDPRKMRTATRGTRMALVAAEMALRDARLPDRWYEPWRMGVTVGTSLGGWLEAEQQLAILWQRGARRVNPFMVNGTPNHAPGAEVASAIGAQGPQLTFSSGCPSSLQAVGHGAMLVATGVVDACVVGGVETPLVPMVLAGMGRTQELSTCNDDPARASRPFDKEHSGMVLSEGSCFLVIETAENAARRGVPSYAEVLGTTSSCDAQGLFGVDPSGEAAARAILDLCQRTAVQPTELDYVCSHANSSPTFDRKETLVIKKAFGECAVRLPVSSIKGILGHPFGASGAFQTAATALAIRHQIIPPTHNLDTPDPECDLDYVPRVPRAASVRNAMVTSYGYGGLNSYLMLGAPQQL